MSKCKFSDLEVRSGLNQKRKLGDFLHKLIFHYTKKESFLNYTFVSDDYLLKMNQDYLKHDTYTDIITFDLSTPYQNAIVSDIFISVDRVKENAVAHGESYPNELLRVILHGALHLSGFGDKIKKDKEVMRSLEEKWMKKFLALK